MVNRGKRSLSLDLGTEPGRTVLRKLIGTADVLLDNFTPRVLRKWDMTYESLRAQHPKLIMLSNTGYGSTGPWSEFKAQGTTLEATMGLMAVTGYRGGPPARAGQSVPDFYACWAGLMAVLAALVERRRSGLGQWIDLGMYQLGPALIPEALLHRQAHGSDPARAGAREWGAAVSAVARCRDGRWLAVSVTDGAEQARLRRVVDSEAEDAAALEDDVRVWAAARDADAAAATLQDVGVPAAAVRDAAGLLADPHLRARGFYEHVPVDELPQPAPLIGRPFRWSPGETAPRIRAGAPRFGEANAYVLEQVLGLTSSEIATLYREGVVTDAPDTPPPARAMDFAALLASGVLTRIDDEQEAIA